MSCCLVNAEKIVLRFPTGQHDAFLYHYGGYSCRVVLTACLYRRKVCSTERVSWQSNSTKHQTKVVLVWSMFGWSAHSGDGAFRSSPSTAATLPSLSNFRTAIGILFSLLATSEKAQMLSKIRLSPILAFSRATLTAVPKARLVASNFELVAPATWEVGRR